ncbi:hypothetical protein WMF28_11110 [Sorangium sp. So ce590]|uniref:hypothetical protein n=1 Tax=Sorangium sp. So ce590 TaxID=3133317 RepID=UPI003F63C340
MAERKGEVLPETVLAMVQARLAALDGEARKVLRAASVFGDVFWRGGVAALLGSAEACPAARDVLSELCDGEVIVRRKESRYRAAEVVAAHEHWGASGYKRTFAHLVHAEALHAAGDREGASAVIAGARERLLARAERLPAAHRRSFLGEIPENARVLELSRQWLRAAS